MQTGCVPEASGLPSYLLHQLWAMDCKLDEVRDQGSYRTGGHAQHGSASVIVDLIVNFASLHGISDRLFQSVIRPS